LTHRLLTAAAFAAAAFATPALATEAAAPTTASFRATYDTFSSNGAVGVFKTDLSGNACEGWASTSLVTIHSPENGEIVRRIAEFEPSDASSLEYNEETTMAGATIMVASGKATRKPDGLHVKGAVNNVKYEVVLPPETMLPIQHDRAVFSSALGGKPFLSASLINPDGKGRLVKKLVTTVSKRRSGETDGDPKELAGMPSFETTTTFFPPDGAGDSLPESSINSVDFTNGVTTSASENASDAGGNSVIGATKLTLRALEIIADTPCSR
jgi:hypothetical protein